MKIDKDFNILKKNKNRDIIQNSYLKTKINQNFSRYYPYLGLTFNKETKNFLNGTIYILHENGNLFKRNIEANTEDEIIQSHNDITKEQIGDILIFLISLRFHWKKKYSKKFFRPELRQIVNFYNLLGYVKPLEAPKKRRRVGRRPK